MILLDRVTDDPNLFGQRRALLSGASLFLPQGRYALLSDNPEYHRALLDLLSGLRPPRRGLVRHQGLVSWPIGRQGFIRGRASGHEMIEFVCALYGIDAAACIDFVSDLVTRPDFLSKSMEHWPLYMRQEFSFALGLAPPFDIYVVEGAIPFEPCRFTRLWQALFEHRITGRTLILSTYRQAQLTDYCAKGLIHERSDFRIEDDLDRSIERFPARQSRSESGGGVSDSGSGDGLAGAGFGF